MEIIPGLRETMSCVKTASLLVRVQPSRGESGKSAWTVNSPVLPSTRLQTRTNSTGFYVSFQSQLIIREARPRKYMTDTNCLFFAVNMKFSFDWCVFAYPDNTILTAAGIACAETCQGPNNNAKTALVDRLLQTNATLQYQYCETENGAFPKVADDCVKCLEKVPNSKAMANCTSIRAQWESDHQTADTDIRWETLDVKALNVACTQKPALGKTLKLDFDLFPDVSTQSPTPSRTQSGAVVTITANPVYPPPSAVSVISASAASQSSAVATAAAQAKAKSDRSRNLGLGVGLTAGGVVAILAILGLIFGRRRAKRNRLVAEEQARARWEADYHARQPGQQQQPDWSEYRKPPAELDTLYNNNSFAPEADDGRPRVQLPSRSTSRTLRNSEIGVAYKQPLNVVAPGGPGKWQGWENKTGL